MVAPILATRISEQQANRGGLYPHPRDAMIKIVFDEISVKATRRWIQGGRRRQETRTFMQTVNPFNKNADGTVKTREQILAELHAERSAWLASFKIALPSPQGSEPK
jgi:hypothetical protein